MKNENDSFLSKAELKNLIGKSDIKSAIEILLKNPESISKDFQNEIILLSAQLNDLEKENIQGTIARKDYSIGRNLSLIHI